MNNRSRTKGYLAHFKVMNLTTTKINYIYFDYLKNIIKKYINLETFQIIMYI